MLLLLPLLLSSAVIPLAPNSVEVRQALARGDVDAAERALAADPEQKSKPGLTLRVLQKKDPSAACAFAQTLLTSDVADVVRLHVASCAPTRELFAALATGAFRHEPRALDAAASFVEKNPLTPIEVALLLGPALDAPLPVSDPAQRKAAARGLALLAQRGPQETQKKALLRLLDELPEQPVADHIRQLDVDANKLERRVARGAVLEKLHMNAEVIALLSDLVGKSCDASLLVGKAQRKLHHYGAARMALAGAVGKDCGEAKKKAQYLEARVARVQGAASADKLLSAFVVEHGKDPLVDDVLLWLAEVRMSKLDAAGAQKALHQIVNEHPTGDMIDEARFRLAMMAARNGKTVDALPLLDEASKTKRVDLQDRARYWRARLAVFPDVESLTPVDKPDTKLLEAFAAERGSSFYGSVARKLLAQLTLPVVDSGAPRVAAASASVPLPAVLEKDARFLAAKRAMDRGFDDDAAYLLTAIVDGVAAGDADGEAIAFAAAALFMQMGRPELAHQTLRDAGKALLLGAPRGDDAVKWSLSWPRAYAAEVEAAADAEKIPRPLLQGLAREESAFISDVVSWAGATGLCQLMPATAKDEARSLKLKDPSTADLLNPSYNARLGAAHLGRRLRGMSHPLLAIGAYNAGPGGVAKWMPPKGKKRPLDIFVEDIPVDETRGYIKKVTGSWITYSILDHGQQDVPFDLWIKG